MDDYIYLKINNKIVKSRLIHAKNANALSYQLGGMTVTHHQQSQNDMIKCKIGESITNNRYPIYDIELTGGIIHKLTRDNRSIFLIGVSHEKSISQESVNAMINLYRENPKTRILVEVDDRRIPHDIMTIDHKTEKTTQSFVNALKEIEHNNNHDNPDIYGWDTRPTLLGCKLQQALYGKDEKGVPLFFQFTFQQVFKVYVERLTDNIRYEKLYQWVRKNSLLSMTINACIKKYPNETTIAPLLMVLRADFADIVDDAVVKLICGEKHKDTNFIIICGSYHYEMLQKKLQKKQRQLVTVDGSNAKKMRTS